MRPTAKTVATRQSKRCRGLCNTDGIYDCTAYDSTRLGPGRHMDLSGRFSMRWTHLAVAAVLATTPGVAGAETPRLIDALRSGDLSAVRALLAQSHPVDERQGDGATALHWAA